MIPFALVLNACAGTHRTATTTLTKPAPPASFAGVRGWGPLTWDMTLPQARAALDAARIYYTLPGEAALDGGRGESRWLDGEAVMVDDPAPAPRARVERPIQRPMMTLALDGGWTGNVTFAGAGGQIIEIVVRHDDLKDANASNAVLADLERQYGAPASTTPANQTIQHLWQNLETRLFVQFWSDARSWHVYEQWTRLR